jgi:hypothetical protein
MRRFAILLAAAATLPAGGCMMKPRHLVYADVSIEGWHVPNFEIARWGRDPNNPRPCPLVLHLPGGDLGEKELSDIAALKRAGWQEHDAGNGSTWLWLKANPPLVRCFYENGKLVGVEVNTLSGNGGGPGVFSVNGMKVSLPATDEAITAALGQPVKRD